MGLEFSHTPARWSYGAFDRFRAALAAHEGIDLDQMAGFRPFGVSNGRDWGAVNTPLKPLLDHSDCDGELTPDECRQVAPRLREVVDTLWPAEDHDAEDHDAEYNRVHGLLLADGMEAAAAAGEPLQFC